MKCPECNSMLVDNYDACDRWCNSCGKTLSDIHEEQISIYKTKALELEEALESNEELIEKEREVLHKIEDNYNLAVEILGAYAHPENWNAPEYKQWSGSLKGPDMAEQFLSGVVGKLDEF